MAVAVEVIEARDRGTARLTFTFHLSNTSKCRNKYALPRLKQQQARAHVAARRDHTSRRAPRHTCAMRHGPRTPTLDERGLSHVAVHGSPRSPFPISCPRLPAPSEAHAAARCIITLSACLSVISPPHTCDVAAGLGSAQGRPRRARAARTPPRAPPLTRRCSRGRTGA